MRLIINGYVEGVEDDIFVNGKNWENLTREEHKKLTNRVVNYIREKGLSEDMIDAIIKSNGDYNKKDDGYSITLDLIW